MLFQDTPCHPAIMSQRAIFERFRRCEDYRSPAFDALRRSGRGT
jgi:hypothetical protein